MTKTCAICGREFEARTSRGKFCSDACRKKKDSNRNRTKYAANIAENRARNRARRAADLEGFRQYEREKYHQRRDAMKNRNPAP
ncbi:hypothetical protein [Breoghania sp.]|uniref:hypothetical protein n=1 Tax=Breoghania sp. TaxID=2065378 RepID=UPI002AA6A963|nr:hypothetical protein [Breoghania sp.]